MDQDVIKHFQVNYVHVRLLSCSNYTSQQILTLFF